jgi:hypothetical protein
VDPIDGSLAEDGQVANYRSMARARRDAARSLLAEGRDESVIYAALELRKSLEALVYELSESYVDDLPKDHVDWQPRKLLQRLLEIDPDADSTQTISITPYREGATTIELGTDYRLSLQFIKKRYDALGNFLHTPTPAQLASSASPAPETIRRKCEEIFAEVEKVLASPVTTFVKSRRVTLTCRRCEGSFTPRVNALLLDDTPPDKRLNVVCPHCRANYQVYKEGAELTASADVRPVPCRYDGCGGEVDVWSSDVKVGLTLSCPRCGGEHKLRMVMSAADRTDGAAVVIDFWERGDG